ncbi:cathepsin L-like isoform X2 [Trifolium pratense]|uniref:cathepsin L-like isoform X2 n=1 Tax=Trifolium pratense TaxID=57577 RepID=UPI001E690B54|nr:cathepsin L-like isoform X2 [Trifolium pratense]XP_045801365.1 cathepsin L-like isoform X2 [Trifolium pratense]
MISTAIRSLKSKLSSPHNLPLRRNLSAWLGNGIANHQVNKSESPEEFEQRIFSPRGNSKNDAVLDKLNQQRTRERSAGNTQVLDDLKRTFDTLSDGMDGKLNNAARFFESDPDEIDKADYSYRYDTTFHRGGKYDIKETKMEMVSVVVRSFISNLSYYNNFLRNFSTRTFPAANAILGSASLHNVRGSEHDLDLLPPSHDWRNRKGVLVDSRNQGECGSCWAFSITHAIQASLKLKRGWSVKVSKQEFLDCINREEDGSLLTLDTAYKYITTYGISLEKHYPYVSHQDSRFRPCRRTGGNRIHISGFVTLKMDERFLMKEVLERPITVGLCAGVELSEYIKGDIFDKETCHVEHPTLPDEYIEVSEPNHSVLLVGYDTRGKIPYWILQNSWGRHWGIKDFFSQGEILTY